MRWDKKGCYWPTERFRVRGHCHSMELHTHFMDTQFQNINCMTQFNENDEEKESRINVLHYKNPDLKVRISFTVVVLFCICSHSKHHKRCAAPKLSQKPEAQTYNNHQNKTSLVRFSTFLKINLSTYCLIFLDALVQKNLCDNQH